MSVGHRPLPPPTTAAGLRSPLRSGVPRRHCRPRQTGGALHRRRSGLALSAVVQAAHRRLHHDQGVVGDNDIGGPRFADRLLNEARAVVGAGRKDMHSPRRSARDRHACRSRTGLGQPGWKVAADHVAGFGGDNPTRDQAPMEWLRSGRCPIGSALLRSSAGRSNSRALSAPPHAGPSPPHPDRAGLALGPVAVAGCA